MGHCWRSKDELISDDLQWTSKRASIGQPRKKYLQQLCTDTVCCLEDLSVAMEIGTNGERERESLGNPCQLHNFMIIIIVVIIIIIFSL